MWKSPTTLLQGTATPLRRPALGQAPTPRAWRPKTSARQLIAAQGGFGDGPVALPEPDDARGAIAVGLKLCEQGQYELAQQFFEKALELPGSGTKRFRDKPNLLSNGEKQAALYNIACCLSKLGDTQNGLIALAGCLEAGYDDFRTVRTDPDLVELRKEPKFEGLLARFVGRGGLSSFFGNL